MRDHLDGLGLREQTVRVSPERHAH
eukprot:COSAG01_NODE_50901_length_359_cov_0.796154_1_plen_24_part_01